ncbi:MAG: hypothetical protein FJZ38_22465 [Candidatus Rokubacteria bacterium]|nr:hypothetical protein [Candidatus Rokubacteria bacterium]
MGARRAVLHDRRGRPSATLDWRADGSLTAATVRIPDGSWLSIEPRAGVEPPWGTIDRISHGATPLTVATAIDWAHVEIIPTVAEPARIPAGGGTAILNLLAILARERGVARLAYTGPYPTEALFLALLESFRPEPCDAPLARFADGALGWAPAPFTPSFDDEVYVQWRGRVEKIVWQGRAYYREDWSGVRRHAPLRTHDVGDEVRASLWALGAPLEDHLVLDADGALRAIVAPPPRADAPSRPLRAAVRDALVAMIAALSAPALADSIREVTASLRFACGNVSAEPARVDGVEVRVSETLARAIAERLAAASAPGGGAAARAQLALAALAEIARAVADPIRARAQVRLAAATPEAQAAALARDEGDATGAAIITAGVADLIAAGRVEEPSGRVDDEPDVERDEADDRHD